MSEARRAQPSLTINGKNVTTKLAEYLESLSYTDVASGSSDSLSLDLHNIGQIWLTQWYPTKGSTVKGSISFKDWNKDGEALKLNCGTFVLDEVKFTGGPLSLSLWPFRQMNPSRAGSGPRPGRRSRSGRSLPRWRSGTG